MEGAFKESKNQKPQTPEQIEAERQAKILKDQSAMFKKMEASAERARGRGQSSWQDRADLNN